MNVDDLEWQSRTLGGIFPRLVTTLVERGEVELLVQAASKQGEWFCAQAAARGLSRAGKVERALKVLEPFIEAGWNRARWERAEVLLEAGRVQQALDAVRPDEEGLASEWVCRDFAKLLARAGRLDEAITVLTPHLDKEWILSTLVELTEGQGRDEQVLELIAPRAQRARSARGEERWSVKPSNAQDLQAQVLERAGRVDEAVRTLGADIAAGHFVVQNTLIAYAELLRRHGRLEELRVLGTGKHAGETLAYYARALEDDGQADEAEAVLRRFIATAEYPDRFRWPLIELLGRQGRIEEAVEVGRPTFDYRDACLFEGIIQLLHEAGRLHDALALPDERSAEFVEEHSSWFSSNRIWLLGEAGLHEEALAYAETLPPDMYGLTVSKAWILEETGRLEEALALLRADTGLQSSEVAELLIWHGRAAEAIAGMPSLAEQHAASRQRDAAKQADRGPPSSLVRVRRQRHRGRPPLLLPSEIQAAFAAVVHVDDEAELVDVDFHVVGAACPLAAVGTAGSPSCLDRPDCTIAFSVQGEGPLLFLVGAPAGRAGFAALAHELAGRFRVVTHDPRGQAPARSRALIWLLSLNVAASTRRLDSFFCRRLFTIAQASQEANETSGQSHSLMAATRAVAS
ncbi:tetratricopeptide repeat protein [Streptomyces sp. NPDC056161]|uniref:tetratricopeptide repeat protein n=1 Tax=Streptomyces sp. NPDC056161 TaxID=3345732 RepID=UPI0035DF612B